MKTRAIGQALETDTAQLIAHLKSRTVGLAEETDFAQALAHLKSRTIGQALETDTALAITVFLGAINAIFNIVERIALFQSQLAETARIAQQRAEEGRFAASRNEDIDF